MVKARKIKPVSVMPDHQTVDDFMTLCKRIDPSDDMKTILENKLMKHVKGCSNEFLQSQKYKHLLKDHIKKITDDPRNVYVYISDFLKELKARKAPQNNEDPHPSKKRKVDQGKVNYEELEEERTQLKIKRLSRFLSQLEKKIKELETVEVNWDDEEDSSYIILQRYKQRACKVFDKLCEYTNESKSAGTIVKIHFSGTDLVKVNKCVQNYINHTGKFPDFIDIQELIKKVNSEENLNLNDDKVQEIAKDVFTKVGEELQRLRMHSVHESLSTFQSGDDPAQTDNDLNCKLRDNHREGERRIQQVIDEFVIKEKEKKAKITSEGTEENGKNEESDQDTDEEEEEEEEEGDDDDDDDDEPFHEDHLPDLSPENEESESPDEEASGPPTEIDDTTTKSNMGLKSDGVPEESMSATNSH